MKPIYKRNIFLLILSALALFSCNDFLDKNPLDVLSNESFWATEAEVEMALTGCYSRLNDEPWFGYRRTLLDCLTDNVQNKYASSDYGYILSIGRGTITETTGGLISDMWSSSYSGISTCNNFLDNVDNVKLNSNSRKQYIGEVRFLRAFFYFQLVHYFGDVIIYTSCPETVEAGKIAKSSKEDVLALIHADLDSAISYLPDNLYSEGHAVKGSALALKTRVLMYEENYEDAASTAFQIIDSKTFKLYDDYQKMFLTSGQEKNNEIMFSVKYYGEDYTSMDQELILWAAPMVRQELVDDYECTDGKSITESPLYDENNPFENRDPRLSMSIMPDTDTLFTSDGKIFNPDPTYTGYFQLKYVDLSALPISTSTRSEQDMIILRYADVLLMYAEAQNEVSGPDATVYSAINDVRERVHMPDIETGLDQDQMREVIRHERRVELALEGLRYYDIKRWKIAHEIMPKVNDVGGNTIVFENPKNYTWPIQETELDLNPKLIQNTYYQ